MTIFAKDQTIMVETGKDSQGDMELRLVLFLPKPDVVRPGAEFKGGAEIYNEKKYEQRKWAAPKVLANWEYAPGFRELEIKYQNIDNYTNTITLKQFDFKMPRSSGPGVFEGKPQNDNVTWKREEGRNSKLIPK